MKHSTQMIFNKNVMSFKNNELHSFLFKHNRRCHWTWSCLPPVNNYLLQVNSSRISQLHPQRCLISPGFLFASWKEPAFFLAMPCSSLPAVLLHLEDTEALVPKAKTCPFEVKPESGTKFKWDEPPICSVPYIPTGFSVAPVAGDLAWFLCKTVSYFPLVHGVSHFDSIANFDCSLFLASLDKLILGYVFPFLSPIVHSLYFTGYAQCHFSAISFNAHFLQDAF